MKTSLKPLPPLLSNVWLRAGAAGALAAGLTACVTVPEASVQPAAECKIVPAQPASLGITQKKQVDRMDQIRAVNEFARFEAATRNLDPRHQLVYEELLRDCNR